MKKGSTKGTIINTKDWNMVECLSAARYVKYTAEDFKSIDKISKGFEGYRENDLSKFCKRVEICTITKCNLKKGIAKHKNMILHSMRKRIDETTKETLDNINKKMKHIEKSMTERVEKIEKQTEV